MEYSRTNRLANTVMLLAISFALFHLYTGLFGTLDTMMQRLVHLSIALLLVFILNPYQTGKPLLDRTINTLMVLIVTSTTGYIYLNYDYLLTER